MRLALVLWCTIATSLSLGGAVAAEDMIDSSQYVSWSKYKPGTTITVSRESVMAGKSGGKSEFKQRLAEITSERAVVETMMMVGTGAERRETTQRVEHPAKVTKGQGRGGLPSGFVGTTTDKGAEPVEIGGRSYQCTLVEFGGEAKGMKVSGTIWQCQQVPGDMAKCVVKMDVPEKGAVLITLKVNAIDAK